MGALSHPGTPPDIRPVIRTDQRRTGRPRSLSCRLSAAGIGFLGILYPPGTWAFVTSGLPPHHIGAADPDGVATFHTHETRPGWVPPRPRDGGVHPAGTISPAGACRFPATSPTPRLPHSIAEDYVTRHHRGFTHVHPSGLPLTCSRRMVRQPLGLNSELHTPPLPVTHVEAGTGIEHSPGTTRSSEPPFEQSSRHVRPRVAR